MNKIQEFFNEKFGTVRTVEINGSIYFVGLDIARALGYSNERKAINTHCKHPIKAYIDVESQNGTSPKARKSQIMLVICKSDIYRLIVRSKLESVEEFENWIFDEILSTIERTGAYIEDGREEEMIERYFPSISDNVKLLMIKDLQKAVKEEQEKNKELQQFYDDLMNTEGLYHMNMVANNLRLEEILCYLILERKR